jgi:hypothetical protein
MSEEDTKNASQADENVKSAADAPAAPDQASGDKPEVVYPKGLELILIVIALCLAVLLVALDQTIIATAIPRITDRFNSVQDIGWYGSVRPPDVLRYLATKVLICARPIF